MSRTRRALTTASAIGAATAVGLAAGVVPASAAEAPRLAPRHGDVAPRGASPAVREAPALRVVAPVPTQRADTLYTVRAGDTVSHIAAKHGSTVQAIVSANGLNSRALIRIGQVLTIPGSATTPAATPSRPAASPAPSTGTRYTVASGDTVSRIAARHGSTVQAIVSANGLNSRALIRIGQVLTIPGAASAPAATPSRPAANPAPAPAPATGARYTVVSGDTVSRIAAKHGTTVAAIVSANGLDSRALIRIGQVLTIPGAASTPAPSAPSTPAPSTTAGTRHTVAAGETVSGIAARYGTTVAAVVSANSLPSSGSIRAGQVLTIPGALVSNTFLHYTYSSDVTAAANANKRALLNTSVPSREAMQQMIRSTATSMGVDPALALAVAYQESGFDARAVSPANAVGVMQVIPSSGEWASDLVGRDLNLLVPQDNVTAGVAILRQLQRSAKDLPTAIAGYYQGLGSVNRNGLYSDTRRYVANVQTLMTRFA